MNPSAAPLSPELALLRVRAHQGGPDDWVRLAQALRGADDMDEAFDLYRRAAEGGQPVAQVEHARMLMHGICCEPDPAAAARWFERLDARGHPVAGYFLALLAAGDSAVALDGRINQRVMRAVQAGHAPALLAAAVHFGRRADPADQQRCLHLLDRGTRLGDPVAAQLLAERLARGEGTTARPDAAAALRAQLAAAGIAAMPEVTVADATGGAIDEGLPPGRLALETAARAASPQMLSSSPAVSRIDGLLSADECRLLIASARPRLRQSRVFDPRAEAVAPMDLRTSSDASFDPILEDLALRLVQLRIASAAGTPLTHAEHLVVLRYRPGEQYRPHRDYRTAGSLQDDVPQAGNRARTICTYLNDVEAGGETEFPVAGVCVKPRAGRAVVFDNLHPDGRPDEGSLHAGLPVERGEKWLATLWLRERRYRHY